MVYHSKRKSIALIAALSLVLMLFAGVKGLTGIEDFGPAEENSFINGRYIENIQSSFEDKLPLKEKALYFWSYLKYRIFREGNSGVLIGTEDWLFSAEEFDENLLPQMSYNDFFKKVVFAADELKKDDVTLILTLIPSKNRILSDKISRFNQPDSILQRYGKTIEHMKKLKLNYIDLREPLVGLPKRTPPFYQFDTHWTREATHAASAIIASKLNPLIKRHYEDRRDYQIIKTEQKYFQGDLLAFVPPLKKKKESYDELTLVDNNPLQLGLFDDPEIPIILVGTSYSNNPRWNFEKELKLALQLDILNMSKEGKGPLEPMEDLLDSAYYKETGSRIVIWEIPERYIPLR